MPSPLTQSGQAQVELYLRPKESGFHSINGAYTVKFLFQSHCTFYGAVDSSDIKLSSTEPVEVAVSVTRDGVTNNPKDVF